MSNEDLKSVIWDISPMWDVSCLSVPKAKLLLSKSKGGSMRKRKRRLAKPLKFTSGVVTKRAKYEWRQDKLQIWSFVDAITP